MPPENKSLKILLVDDDQFLLDIYMLKFKKTGATVETSSNSTHGLEKLRTGDRYDIVIVDIIMPGVDGIDFLKKAREEKLMDGIIFIMLTNQVDSANEASSLGADGYIIKASTVPSEVVDKVLEIYNKKHNYKNN